MEPTAKLTPESPRLSTSRLLAYPRRLDICQACGRTAQECALDLGPRLWQECDHNDQPEFTAVVLCRACSDIYIGPHVRLYHSVPVNAPFPGAMPLCVQCTFQNELRCTHPKLKANGGPGLVLRFPQSGVAMVDGQGRNGRRTGWVQKIYAGPVTHCEGRVVSKIL